MNRVVLTAGLTIFPSLAYASDPTGLMVLLCVAVLIVVAVLGFIVFLSTNLIVNYKLKYFLRIIPFTIFLSPSGAVGAGYIWPAGIVFIVGNEGEKLSAFISVFICTALIYFILLQWRKNA